MIPLTETINQIHQLSNNLAIKLYGDNVYFSMAYSLVKCFLDGHPIYKIYDDDTKPKEYFKYDPSLDIDIQLVTIFTSIDDVSYISFWNEENECGNDSTRTAHLWSKTILILIGLLGHDESIDYLTQVYLNVAKNKNRYKLG